MAVNFDQTCAGSRDPQLNQGSESPPNRPKCALRLVTLIKERIFRLVQLLLPASASTTPINCATEVCCQFQDIDNGNMALASNFRTEGCEDPQEDTCVSVVNQQLYPKNIAACDGSYETNVTSIKKVRCSEPEITLCTIKFHTKKISPEKFKST